MKKITLLIALAIVVTACGGKKENNESVKATDQITYYLAVKDALVLTDGAKAQSAAKAFLSTSENVSLKSDLEMIAGTSDVKVQRQAFEALSMKMYELVQASGSDSPLYKQYCPMAFNNTGAYWLAAEMEVNNPYFGDKMLHCGSVQEKVGG